MQAGSSVPLTVAWVLEEITTADVVAKEPASAEMVPAAFASEEWREPCHRRQLHVPGTQARSAEPARPDGPVALVHRRGGRPGGGNLRGPGASIRNPPPSTAEEAGRGARRLAISSTKRGIHSRPPLRRYSFWPCPHWPRRRLASPSLRSLFTTSSSPWSCPGRPPRRCTRATGPSG